MKSFLYKELTEYELTSIIQLHFLSTKKFDYSLLKGGLFNTTYKIDLLDRNESYVLRVGPINRQLLLPYEHNLMEAEKHVYALLKDANIPCPEIIAYNTTHSLIDRDYLLEKYISAYPMSEINCSPEEKAVLYDQLGKCTRQMHNIKSSIFGRVSNILAGTAFDSWGEYVLDEITYVLNLLTRNNLLTLEKKEAIKDLFLRSMPLFAEVKVGSLVHADLWEGNVLISQNKNQIAAIIDADRAVFGDPEFEFASPWITSPAFYKGYGRKSSVTPESNQRNILYQIIYRALDTYIWAVEYSNLQESTNNKKELLRLCDKLA